MRSIVRLLSRSLAIASGTCLIFAAQALPDRISVAWNPNPESNLGGYFFYYGVVDSGVTNKLSPGAASQQLVVDLLPQTQYWFFVTAFNTDGVESLPSEVLTYTTPANLAPTVTLGVDRIAIIPDAVALTAVASDDHLEENALAATWSQLSGPATVGIAGGTALSPVFQFTVAGDYAFRVTVSDGVSSSFDEVTVHAYQTVTNPSPGNVVPNISNLFSTLDGLVIQWDSKQGKSYRIGLKEDLNQPSWAIVADNIASQGPTSYWVDSSGQLSAQGFYAVFQIP